jgi:leucyl-tRNA synthetase
LWETLGYKTVLLREPWPKFDPELAKEDEVEVPVQINGKIRSHVVIAIGTPDERVRELALADEKIKAGTDGKQITRVIIVPNKLVNIVVR